MHAIAFLEKFGSAPLASFGTSASSDLPCLSVLPSVPVSNEMLQASVMRGMQTPQRRSVEKLMDAVGRTFKARVELDSKGRVVHLRNATLNSTLQPLWHGNEVFVRVLRMSDSTAKEGKGASVTAAFAVDEEWLEGMTPATDGGRGGGGWGHGQGRMVRLQTTFFGKYATREKWRPWRLRAPWQPPYMLGSYNMYGTGSKPSKRVRYASAPGCPGHGRVSLVLTDLHTHHSSRRSATTQ